MHKPKLNLSASLILNVCYLSSNVRSGYLFKASTLGKFRKLKSESTVNVILNVVLAYLFPSSGPGLFLSVCYQLPAIEYFCQLS